MIVGSWPTQLNSIAPFHQATDGFRYLGIVITPRNKDLLKANYSKLLAQLKTDISRWEILPLTLLGRIESIRMNVLPRFLFLFQSLPIQVPNKTFKTIDKLIIRHIWQNKRHRIRLKTLLLPKQNGGLALPHFRKYYWAAQLRILVHWIKNDTDRVGTN